jgi:hypothetical protein
MIDGNQWFNLLAFAILLILGIYVFLIFLRWRTKYNLATLIIIVIFLAVTAFDFLSPGKLSSMLAKLIFVSTDSAVVTKAVLILIGVIFTILLCTFFFYPDIKRFISRRKTKNK